MIPFTTSEVCCFGSHYYDEKDYLMNIYLVCLLYVDIIQIAYIYDYPEETILQAFKMAIQTLNIKK